jgi:hypothetical protein
MDYYKSGAQVGPHMQPEEASDIGRFDLSLTELQPKDTSVDQRKHENIGNPAINFFDLYELVQAQKAQKVAKKC